MGHGAAAALGPLPTAGDLDHRRRHAVGDEGQAAAREPGRRPSSSSSSPTPTSRCGGTCTTGYLAISNSAVRTWRRAIHFKKNPDQYTAFAQTAPRASRPPNSQGLRLGNFAQIRDVIEAEMENVFAGKKTAKQGLDDAVAKSQRDAEGVRGARTSSSGGAGRAGDAADGLQEPVAAVPAGGPRRWRSPSSSSSGPRSSRSSSALLPGLALRRPVDLRRAGATSPSSSPIPTYYASVVTSFVFAGGVTVLAVARRSCWPASRPRRSAGLGRLPHAAAVAVRHRARGGGHHLPVHLPSRLRDPALLPLLRDRATSSTGC